MMKEDAATKFALTGDAAKQVPDEDEFGLRLFAEIIATVIGSRTSARGYAIGIEGPWGSGKTTVLNFLQHELNSNAQAIQRVIRFEPWLVGTRRELLSEFFTELSRVLGTLTTDRNVVERLQSNPRLLERLIATVNQYSEQLSSGLSLVDKAATIDPSLHLLALGWLARALFFVLRFLTKRPASLEQLRARIIGDLYTLEKLLSEVRIAVLIDDTDRLDPAESVEILRLIKSIANFPLVTYVVAFDRNIMSAQVQQCVSGGTGEEYIEKIFQQITPIPPQEPFALRRFVRARLSERFPGAMKLPHWSEVDKLARHDCLFDKWLGVLLKTPRDAIRLCEAVEFGWPYLDSNADFLDFVWLQLLKLKCRDLYAWTENYVANIGSCRDRGRPADDSEAEVQAASLKSILTRIGWSTVPNRSDITYFLPGLQTTLHNGAKNTVYDFESFDELKKFEEDRRLASPSHWRLYFAFEIPSYALDDSELDRLQRASRDDVHQAAQTLRELARRDHPTPGHYLDIALDRLHDRIDKMTSPEQIGLALAFAEVMDDIPRGTFAQYLGDEPWRRATRLLGKGIAPYWNELVRTGKSINWICYVMRILGSAIEKTGPDTAEYRWLDRTEFDDCVKVLFNRLRVLDFQTIIKMPEPLDVFYFYKRFAPQDEFAKFVDSLAETDARLIATLKAMRTPVLDSKRGNFLALQESVLRDFFDLPQLQERLVNIGRNRDPQLQGEAAKILSALPASNILPFT